MPQNYRSWLDSVAAELRVEIDNLGCMGLNQYYDCGMDPQDTVKSIIELMEQNSGM